MSQTKQRIRGFNSLLIVCVCKSVHKHNGSFGGFDVSVIHIVTGKWNTRTMINVTVCATVTINYSTVDQRDRSLERIELLQLLSCNVGSQVECTPFLLRVELIILIIDSFKINHLEESG